MDRARVGWGARDVLSVRARWSWGEAIAVALVGVGCGAAPVAASAPSASAPAKSAASTSAPMAASSSASSAPATSAVAASAPIASAVLEPATPTAPVAKSYRRVLSVGDSFNGAFSLALEKHFRAEGAEFSRDTWVAVAISTFARAPRFGDLLAKHDPDLVLVNLGANHVDDEAPEASIKHIRAIVDAIGARDCYWIAPALWKKDKGIVDVLARSVAPCRFFDSKGFKVERRGDGWHPSVEGGALWAERFWQFFQKTNAS
jgi:hypothetical protein